MSGAMLVAALDGLARGVFALALVALLLAGMAGMVFRRVPPMLATGAAQGGVLAVAMLAQAWLLASPWLLAVAALVAAVRAVGLPMMLRQMHLGEAAHTPRAGVAAAVIGLVGLAAWLGAAAPGAPNGLVVSGGLGVVVPLALALLGCLGLALRPDVAGRVGGVMALESAAVLAAAGVADLPGVGLVALCACGLSAAVVAVAFRRALPAGGAL